jgi:hypothetical protein
VGPVKRKGRVRRVGWDEVARPPVTVRQVHIRPVGRCTCAQAPFLAAYSSTDALRISEVSAARRAAVSVLKYAGAPMRPGLERFAVLRVDVRPGGPAARMAPWVDCDSVGLRARQGCFVAVLGEVTADAALIFRLTGVDGFFRRVVVAFHRQDRVCVLVLGARVVLQHAGARLLSGGEVDGACFAGGALVPQLREPTADVPVLFQDRSVDLGLAALVVVSHTEQYAGCRVIALANLRAFAGPTRGRASGR